VKQETPQKRAAAWWVVLPLVVLATAAQAADGLNLVPRGDLLVLLIVGFVVLVWPVNALIFKPLFRVLDEREQRIAGARERASTLDGEANELLERYQEAIREVREESEHRRHSELEAARSEQTSRSDQARQDARGVLEQGRTELDGWLATARGELENNSEPLARTAAERVLGRSLS